MTTTGDNKDDLLNNLSFKLPDFSISNSSTWGPTASVMPSFSGLPFTPFSKRDTSSLNYISDWDPFRVFTYSRNRNYNNNRNNRNRSNNNRNKNNNNNNNNRAYLNNRRRLVQTNRARNNRSRSVQFGSDAATVLGVGGTGTGGGGGDIDDDDATTFDDNGFVLQQKKKYDIGIKKWRRDRTKQASRVSYSQGRMEVAEQKKMRAAPKTQTRKKKIKQKRARRRRYVENPRPMQASIKKQDHWIDVRDIWFRDTFEIQNNFTFTINGIDNCNKIQYEPQSKKLLLSGILHGVLTKYDNYKTSILDFEKYSDYKYLSFKYKPATNDQYILDIAGSNTDTSSPHTYIYTTDNVLTTIMCCPRSKYSFDIVINKIGNKIFLDERSKILSNFNVDETSQYRPTKKGTSRMNSYEKLFEEATYINHVFNEQMVFHNNNIHRFKKAYPFLKDVIKGNKNKKGGKRQTRQKSSSQQQQASSAFIYKQFDLTDNITIIARCTVDGYIINPQNPKSKHKDWCIIRALNQYNSTKSKTIPWRTQLISRQSSILAQEVTNNNFKCARWGMNAYLSDARYIKLGFIIRKDVHSTEKHLICGVKTYETQDFIKNKLKIRSINTCWTILGKFLKNILDLDTDSRYIALRDPLKQVVRVYTVSPDSFTKEDGLPSLGWLKKRLNYKPSTNTNTNVGNSDLIDDKS